MNLQVTAQRAATALHRHVFDLTKGRLAGRAFGMAALKLTTTGRKSGLPRDTMITTPVHDDRRVVLVASNGGNPKHPLWYLNLSQDPNVKVTMKGRTRSMVARTATADEKAELWPLIVEAYKGYANYQAKVDRDIPVVVIEDRPE